MSTTATSSPTEPHPSILAAERLAPEPPTREEATTDGWVRHYAAQGLAAHAAFRDALPALGSKPAPGSRPDLGELIAAGMYATAAAVALTEPRERVAQKLWNLTPELGALNGESLDWLAETLDGLGVNPADIDRAFESADFRSPVAAGVQVGRTADPVKGA
jgi:hypothetical protein